MERKIISIIVILFFLAGCSFRSTCEYNYTLDIYSSSHGFEQKTSVSCCVKDENNPKCIPKNRDLIEVIPKIEILKHQKIEHIFSKNEQQ